MAAAAIANPREITQSLLYLDGVTVSFDGFRALNNLSLDLAHGEMRAIIGPNGAGKTTMMDVITGKTRPDKGEVLFDNGSIDLTAKDEAAIAQLGIGRKFQKPTVFDDHTVEDNVLLALKGDRTVGRNLFWRPNGDAERIDDILKTIALTAHRQRLAGALSHGQKQWLEIGMLLAQDPKLLLVDEPVAGMTDAETMTTAELLQRHRQGPHRDRGRARHGVRAPAGREGDGAARRLGAGRRHPRRRQRQRARGRSLSGAVMMRASTFPSRMCGRVRARGEFGAVAGSPLPGPPRKGEWTAESARRC